MTKRRRQRGRPPIDPRDVRDRLITVRVSGDELLYLQRQAARKGLSVGGWIRVKLQLEFRREQGMREQG